MKCRNKCCNELKCVTLASQPASIPASLLYTVTVQIKHQHIEAMQRGGSKVQKKAKHIKVIQLVNNQINSTKEMKIQFYYEIEILVKIINTVPRKKKNI